jgi:hypothetical protein
MTEATSRIRKPQGGRRRNGAEAIGASHFNARRLRPFVVGCNEGGCGVERLLGGGDQFGIGLHPAEDQRPVEAFYRFIDPAHFDEAFAEVLQDIVFVIGGVARACERERLAEDRFREACSPLYWRAVARRMRFTASRRRSPRVPASATASLRNISASSRLPRLRWSLPIWPSRCRRSARSPASRASRRRSRFAAIRSRTASSSRYGGRWKGIMQSPPPVFWWRRLPVCDLSRRLEAYATEGTAFAYAGSNAAHIIPK